MIPSHLRGLCLLAVVLVAGACQASPSGPSVSFTSPLAKAPAVGEMFAYTQQPVVLSWMNAARSGETAVTYDVEVSASATFASQVTALTGIAEGTGGNTSVSLPVLSGGVTYFWRSRSVVDGDAGPFSPVASFGVRPQVTLQAPEAVSPVEQDQVLTGRPTFVVRNAARSGQPGSLTYEFQVSLTSSFGALAASAVVPEQPGQTSWAPSSDLPVASLFWRARALDQTNAITGPFSSVRTFERRPSTGDQFDLSAVTILLGPTNIATWPVSAVVTNAAANGAEICIEHQGLGAWPSTIFFDDPAELVQGNQWMFALINGRWYGGAGRWFRPGQACKGINNDPFAGTFYMDGTDPLRSYVPRPGDTIGLMSTTPNRFYPSMRTLDQRTNVVLVRFGG